VTAFEVAGALTAAVFIVLLLVEAFVRTGRDGRN
jgi:hypothetical protein